MECACWGAWCEGRCPCSKLLRRPWCLSCGALYDAPADPTMPWKGVPFVALLTFFSLSSIFLLKVFASFSSTNDRPARQSSSSNE